MPNCFFFSLLADLITEEQPCSPSVDQNSCSHQRSWQESISGSNLELEGALLEGGIAVAT
jgi:hypothetical protein